MIFIGYVLQHLHTSGSAIMIQQFTVVTLQSVIIGATENCLGLLEASFSMKLLDFSFVFNFYFYAYLGIRKDEYIHRLTDFFGRRRISQHCPAVCMVHRHLCSHACAVQSTLPKLP